jgi:hypothetical protein
VLVALGICGLIFVLGLLLFVVERRGIGGALLMSACVATAFLIVFMWASGLRW